MMLRDPAAAVTFPGVAGAVVSARVVAVAMADGAELPFALVAMIRYRYVVDGARPVLLKVVAPVVVPAVVQFVPSTERSTR